MIPTSPEVEREIPVDQQLEALPLVLVEWGLCHQA